MVMVRNLSFQVEVHSLKLDIIEDVTEDGRAQDAALHTENKRLWVKDDDMEVNHGDFQREPGGLRFDYRFLLETNQDLQRNNKEIQKNYDKVQNKNDILQTKNNELPTKNDEIPTKSEDDEIQAKVDEIQKWIYEMPHQCLLEAMEKEKAEKTDKRMDPCEADFVYSRKGKLFLPSFLSYKNC
ncbi:hypothetical protein VZT92_016232 [Zoarces viviparus]|uniref:Uncharacterized protein n=1 Tax=Zoarces viviparus TaxID=48416 RepID=A0AAW1ET91_ZOAVI